MWQTINYVEELKKNHEKEMVELDSRYKRFIDTMKEFGPDAANKIVSQCLKRQAFKNRYLVF
jgi:hypothetical protein